MTLTDLFQLSLAGRRESTALEFQDRTYTFGEIEARAARMAAVLSARGLRVGDRLCVYLANCVEWVDLYLACVRLGVILTPINILYREREIGHILEDAGPKAVVVSGELPCSAPANIWQVADLLAEAESGRHPAAPL
ncbi:MAG TPA: AMP-binding protein, partial [Bryobacteraceae bacterium]|nr:AMP-binding protein [Bryobacteraceae bacterium]